MVLNSIWSLPVFLLIVAPLLLPLLKKSYLTPMLIISNALVFIYTFFLTESAPDIGYAMRGDLVFSPEYLLSFEAPQTLLTSLFMHSTSIHLFMNMIIHIFVGLPL